MRFFIMLGFSFMLLLIHIKGDLNKYINTRYAYLSISAIIILSLLSIIEFMRLEREEKAEEKRKMDHGHEPIPGHHHGHDHTHAGKSKLKQGLGNLILCFPILTGLLLPVQTLDSSFVKAKGFAFPKAFSEDNSGQHQFLRPDTSVFYGAQDIEGIRNAELSDFSNRKEILLTDQEYLKGMEVIYNFPESFMGKTIAFDGFSYKGEQVDGNHYFVFRFGFIHCAADSGVFGMLVEFPKDTALKDDDWVHVSGELTWELYQPFKQTIPVLKVAKWNPIKAPKDPYVYRMF